MKTQPKKDSKRKQIFDSEGLETFAIQLKKIRMSMNYTQRQLAFEAGISLSQIARIETARINPTLSTIFAIARALDIPLASIFDFSLPAEKNPEASNDTINN